MFPVLQLGPFAVQTAGLALLLSFALGSSLAEREARQLGVDAALVSNGILLALAAGLIGARLVYAARYLDTYRASPAGLIALNPSALAVPEGIAIAAAAALFYWWVKELPLRAALDALTPLLAVLAIGIGVAHLAAGTAYGAATRVPWAIHLWDEYRHPSQAYEIVAAALVYVIIVRARRFASFPGFLFLSWLTLSATARLFLETFRGDTTLILGGLRLAQVLSLVVLLLGLWLMGRWARPGGAEPEDGPEVASH
ncbi:MAG TPA: prolipoprotein diacylglyceryl transferase family protein [Anaerolineae bacterium]